MVTVYDLFLSSWVLQAKTMKRFSILSVVIIVLTGCSPSASETSTQANSPEPVSPMKETHPPSASEERYTYVLVHGSSGGGWDWKTMDELQIGRAHV